MFILTEKVQIYMKRQIELVYRALWLDASVQMQHFKKQLLDSYSHWLITFTDLNYMSLGFSVLFAVEWELMSLRDMYLNVFNQV